MARLVASILLPGSDVPDKQMKVVAKLAMIFG